MPAGVQAQILFKRRHQLNLAYYALDRRASKVVEREIPWRDRTFPVDALVSAFWNTEITELSYTCWWIAREYRRRIGDKLMFRGMARAITFSDIDEITNVVVYDFALQLEHRTFKNAGIAALAR